MKLLEFAAQRGTKALLLGRLLILLLVRRELGRRRRLQPSLGRVQGVDEAIIVSSFPLFLGLVGGEVWWGGALRLWGSAGLVGFGVFGSVIDLRV